MRAKIPIIFLTIGCAVVLLLALVKQVGSQWPNPGRLMTCWIGKIWYNRFEIKAYFSSRTRTNILLHEDSRYEPDDIDFDPRRGTAVIVHGFLSTGQDIMMNQMRDALLIWKDINVIVLDWQRGCNNFLIYQKAAANTEFVALNIKEIFLSFRDFFKTVHGIDPNEWGPVHLIGFSLGAHVVGHAGRLLGEAGFAVDRVTGLDPAEPCFEDDDTLRLGRDSAIFVDVIHTDAATSRNDAFGLWEPIGHVDFYVNGGKNQPGCWFRKQPWQRRLAYATLFKHTVTNGNCHHSRAPEIFIQTLLQAVEGQCQFWAHPWDMDNNPILIDNMLQNKCDENTCVEMGIRADQYIYTSEWNYFYVETSGHPPYCDV